MEEKEYFKEGQIGGVVGGMITLILGVGISIMIMVFLGVLSGQVYEQSEASIDAISNTTIKNSIKGAAVNSFDAYEKTGSYMPLIVLALVIGLVLSVVLGFMNFGGGNSGRAL